MASQKNPVARPLYPNYQHIDLPCPALDADGLNPVLELSLRIYYSTTTEQEPDDAGGLEPRYVDAAKVWLHDVTIVIGAREVPVMLYLGAEECSRCEAAAQSHADEQAKQDAAVAADARAHARFLDQSANYLGEAA